MQTNDQIRAFIIITTTIIFMLAALIVMLLFIYQQRQLAYQKSLDSLKHDFEKNLLKSQVEIQEQTFQAISREIHDNVNLSLILAKLNLSTLDLAKSNNIASCVESTIAALGIAITDLSDLSRTMNTDVIKNMGLLKALGKEIERLNTYPLLSIHYELNGEPIYLEAEKELIVFRIIQEAFNNVLKHSNASNVWLQLDYQLNSLNVLVKDDGIGFIKEDVWNKKAIENAGFINMRTRAGLFGGKVLLETRPQKGTYLLITLPYN